jgi:transcriptional regulator GlxA family with amidase domain
MKTISSPDFPAGLPDVFVEVPVAHIKRTVGILIFDEVEILDFCGPFEVFSTAWIPEMADREERRLFQCSTVAPEKRIVPCRGGLRVEPHYDLENAPLFDIIVLPGGFGTEQARFDPRIQAWVQRHLDAGALTTTVCTGLVFLAQIGAIDGLPVTSHWETLDWFRREFPALDVRGDQRVIDQGQIVTSAGVSAGIDMALSLVARLHGIDIARETARGMEYVWNSAGLPSGSPAT